MNLDCDIITNIYSLKMLQMFPKSLSAYSSRTCDRVFRKRKPGNMFPKMEMALWSDLVFSSTTNLKNLSNKDTQDLACSQFGL